MSASGRLRARPLWLWLGGVIRWLVHLAAVDLGFQESSLPDQLGNLALAVSLDGVGET